MSIEIEYKSTKLKKLCENDKKLTALFGAVNARKIVLRLNQTVHQKNLATFCWTPDFDLRNPRIALQFCSNLKYSTKLSNDESSNDSELIGVSRSLYSGRNSGRSACRHQLV